MKTCIRHLSRSIVIYGAMLLATNLHGVLVKEDNKGCNNLSRKSFSSSRKRAANRHNRAKEVLSHVVSSWTPHSPSPFPPFPPLPHLTPCCSILLAVLHLNLFIGTGTDVIIQSCRWLASRPFRLALGTAYYGYPKAAFGSLGLI